jgi:biopolymer transport protein ExbD
MILAQREPRPLVEMNTTPLIDVMLVLLVMFIITIPTQTHSIKLDLPQGSPPLVQVNKTANELAITAGNAILWNGQVVSRDVLAEELSASARMDPQPELHLRPDPYARYELVDEVLATAKRAGVTRIGFVDNEQYQNF